MSEPLALIFTSLSVSGPTFAWVLLGVLLRRVGLLGQRYIDRFSGFAFTVGIPILLFSSAATVDYSKVFGASYLLAGVLATLTTLSCSALYAYLRRFPRQDAGVFVQAAFRSNLAIVGIALCHAAYGDSGVALAALPVAVMTALYNILAVWVLSLTHEANHSIGRILIGMARNPLLIGILLGVFVALLKLPLPALVGDTAGWLSTYFLPMTLVAIGASIQLNTLHRLGRLAWEATAWRLCVAPALGLAVALLLAVEGQALGVIFLLLSAPVAAASFVMVVAAKGNATSAANVIVLSTLLSSITVTLGFSVLVYLGLVGDVQGVSS
ncbi:AEC family transporter [Parahaliea sp. F7430]|uniref:AEC family transporter n=1 Tax=Sediminihaliea albiluteola TaxID=2758564 RepID=A0A7W2YIX4_9GAMM|nr:AEC family transporter [Sediminihaliea albiluteola]MBA6412507.1 AEC family transporter [Sediminihaliea albiluteola]